VVLQVSTDARPATRSEPHAKKSETRARVLVVDDEPRIGSAISRILGPQHDVTAVSSATEALARLESGEDYDVILCDVLMPQMTGTDLYRSLEEKAPGLTRRIVFMTGGPFSMRGANLLESVTNRRLEKPFSPEALRDTIRELVDER
jgi:CheY-like chemotaxis protein